MSSFSVKVVRIVKMEKHPNADTLSIVDCGWPVVVRTQDFKVGDIAVFVPPCSQLPLDDTRWSFMDKSNKKRVIRAIRLRGVISQGLLWPAESDMKEGDDVAERWRITKYEPPIPVHMAGVFIPNPDGFPHYQDIENYQTYPGVFKDGEHVIVTDKLHGTNCKIGVWNGEDFVGSHKMMLQRDEKNLYWGVALKEEIHKKMRNVFPEGRNVVVFGEIVGDGVQKGYSYNCPKNHRELRVFDIWVDRIGYLPYDEMLRHVEKMGLKIVPMLYDGPWGARIVTPEFGLIGGNDPIDPSVEREGIVIASREGRFSEELRNRAVLKFKNPEFEAREAEKGGSEFH